MKRVLAFILMCCLGSGAFGAEPAARLFKKTASSKLGAVTGYLFNMHLIYPGKNPPSIPGNALPLAAAGAADILYTYKPSAGFTDIYISHQEEIQKTLAEDLRVAGVPYEAGAVSAAKERTFLNMLGQSAQSGYYFYCGGPGPENASVAADARRRVKEAIAAGLKNLKNKVALNPASENVFNTNFYMNAADDCGTCSHYICDAFCTAHETPHGWNIRSVYRVTVLPAQGARTLRTAKGEQNFFSPRGKKYVRWEYHSAALAVLEKGKEVIYLAADPLLLKKPADFAYWAALFDPQAKFILRPFDGGAALENGKDIIPKHSLPKCSVHAGPYLD